MTECNLEVESLVRELGDEGHYDHHQLDKTAWGSSLSKGKVREIGRRKATC